MLLNNILLEARKNPQLNPKVSINNIVRRAYLQAGKLSIGVKNSFVSFTEIEKLGINPKSTFRTPLGIYCYPSEYILKQTHTLLKKQGNELPMSSLPFAGENPYINIFNIDGHILRIDNMTLDKYNELLALLRTTLKSKYNKVYDIEKQFDKIIDESFDKAFHKMLLGGLLWYITMELSIYIGKQTSKSSILLWNVLFRDIGIDCVVDIGKGIIHEAEPTQAVIFNVQAIRNNIRADNKYSKQYIDSRINDGSDIKRIAGIIDSMSFNELKDAVMSNPILIRAIKDVNVCVEILKLFPRCLQFIDNITERECLLLLQHTTFSVLIYLIGGKNVATKLQNAFKHIQSILSCFRNIFIYVNIYCYYIHHIIIHYHTY